MKLMNTRSIAWTALFVIALGLPSLLLQDRQATAQAVPTATATSIATTSMNPFPKAAWQTEQARAVNDALRLGIELQSAQLPPETLIDEAQFQSAPAASSRVLLPYVQRAVDVVPPTQTPSPTKKPDTGGDDEAGADVGMGIWPNPSVYVTRNGSIAYELRASNFGKGKATSTHVYLPYNKKLMTIYGSTIPGDDDWVSEITDSRVTFTFGNLASGEQRTATLYFHVAGNLGNGTTLPMQATYTWSDGDDGGSGKTNKVPVTVGNTSADSAWAKFTVWPVNVKRNQAQQFVTDRYAPSEGVVFWLNLPDGDVRALNETAVADNAGAVTLKITFKELPSGNFSLVGQGQRSGTIVVGFFTVMN